MLRRLFMSSNCRKVTVEEGVLEESGLNFRTDSGKVFNAYLGIPYGEADRFKKPRPAPKWDGVLKADRYIECSQPNDFGLRGPTAGQENPLVLNIYTPMEQDKDEKDENTKGLAVLVWIHGGGFTSGSGSPSLYGPEYFMEQPNFILVALNYRLGPLGFLGMNDDVLPGNLGLWDQVLALKWIQKNISTFGGDPDRVTICGQSAGGVCVSLHTLSKQSKGLFSSAITQSGIFTIPYPKTDKHPAYYARTLTKELGGNPDGTSEEIYQFLKTIDADKLILSARDMTSTFVLHLPNGFRPHVDVGTSDPFLPTDPWDVLESGDFNHVPLIHGYNLYDNSFMMAPLHRQPERFKQLQENWDEVASLFAFSREKDEVTEEDREVVRYYLDKYLDGQIPKHIGDSKKLADLITLFYQVNGGIGVQESARKNKAPVYSYVYAHAGAVTLADFVAFPIYKLLVKKIASYAGLNWYSLSEEGPCHSDDVFVEFKFNILPFDARGRPEDKRMGEKLCELWVNFAKYHNPTPETNEWTSHDSDGGGKCAKLIDGKVIMEETTEEVRRIAEWEEVTKKIPRKFHKYSSKTWSDPTLYRGKKM